MESKVKNVRILAPWLPKYRIPFFKRLVDIGVNDGINYQIYFGEAPKEFQGRNDIELDLSFNSIETSEIKFLNRSIIVHKTDSKWLDVDLVILEHAIRNLELYKFLFFRHPRKIALWGHGRTFTKRKSRFEEHLKLNIVKKCDWFFGYTRESVDAVVGNGYPMNRTTIVYNSTDTVELQSLRARFGEVNVDSIANKYGIKQTNYVAAFFGSLYDLKRIDFLCEAAIKIHEKFDKFVLVIVGEGPESEKWREKYSSFDCIRWLGRGGQEMLAEVSLFSNFILNPGAVGLIAVDSFALELPIVTTSYNFHGPEFAYLEHNFNSVVAENTMESFIHEVFELVENAGKLAKLKDGCRQSAKHFSIENMVRNYHEGVMQCLEL